MGGPSQQGSQLKGLLCRAKLDDSVERVFLKGGHKVGRRKFLK